MNSIIYLNSFTKKKKKNNKNKKSLFSKKVRKTMKLCLFLALFAAYLNVLFFNFCAICELILLTF